MTSLRSFLPLAYVSSLCCDLCAIVCRVVVSRLQISLGQVLSEIPCCSAISFTLRSVAFGVTLYCGQKKSGSSIGFVGKPAMGRRQHSPSAPHPPGISPLLRFGASAEKPAKLREAASNAFFYLASFGSPRVRSLAHAPLTVRRSREGQKALVLRTKGDADSLGSGKREADLTKK